MSAFLASFTFSVILTFAFTSPDSRADTSDDDCSNAATITGNEVTCSGTRNIIKAGQITNQVGQQAASGIVNSMGAAATAKAQQSGNISEMQKAAADIADNGANAQLVQGGVNAALGAWQLIQAQKLKSAANQIKSQTDASKIKLQSNVDFTNGTVGSGQDKQNIGYVKSALGNAYADNALTKFNLNDKHFITDARQEKLTQCQTNPSTPGCPKLIADLTRDRENFIKREIAQKGLQAAGEVKGVSNEALAAGGASLITGLGQLAAGAINKQAAQNLRDASNVKLNTGAGTTFTPTGGFGKYDMDTQNIGGGNVINGSGDQGPTQQASEPEKDKEEQKNTDFDLGPGGGGPKDGSQVVTGGPAAGGFQVGQEGGVVSGGGGGGLGGGHTSAATPDAESGTQPTMADMRKKNSDMYGQTGAFLTPGGGGQKGGADGGAGGTPSLNDLLAQFMPKKDDEGKNGILDFGGGPGRAPASEAPYSFLGKNTNIFETISQGYKNAGKRGAL